MTAIQEMASSAGRSPGVRRAQIRPRPNKSRGFSTRVLCIVSLILASPALFGRLMESSALLTLKLSLANGIALESSGPSDALSVAKVEGFPNSVQIKFNRDVPADGITLEASRHSGSSSSDVSWNGEPLTQTVAPPRGGSGSRKIPPRTSSPATAGGAGAIASTSQNRQAASTSRDASSEGLRQRSSTASQQLSKVSETATDLATVHRLPKDSQGQRQLPDDAMLILTRDLYL